jgi:hypothetical protein
MHARIDPLTRHALICAGAIESFADSSIAKEVAGSSMVSRFGRFNFSSTHARVSADRDEGLNQAESELDRLQRELHALKATLADRETALAKAALDAREARGRWQEELASRLAAAESEWRQHSATAFADVAAAQPGSDHDAEEQPLAEQHSHIEAGADQVSAAVATSATLADTTQESNIVIRTNRVWAEAVEAADDTRRASRQHALFGVVAAASLAILAITAMATTGGRPVEGSTSQDFAVALSGVNVRSGPSTVAKVISTLPRGVKVATIEERGSWTLVQFEDAGRDAAPRKGWVHGSLLKRQPSPR